MILLILLEQALRPKINPKKQYNSTHKVGEIKHKMAIYKVFPLYLAFPALIYS